MSLSLIFKLKFMRDYSLTENIFECLLCAGSDTKDIKIDFKA